MNNYKPCCLCGGNLKVTLLPTSGGAALGSIEDAKGLPLFEGAPRPLFALKIRELATKCDRVFFSDADFAAFRAEWEGELCRLYFSAPGGLTGLTVILTVCPEAEGLVWHTAVENLREDISLTGVEYPRVWFCTRESTKLFYPRGCGIVWKNMAAIELRRSCKYPTSQASMSYFALYDGNARRGLYVGYEDRQGIYKEMRIDKEAEEREGCLSAMLPAESMGLAHNSQELPGRAVWRLFDGDWYDAALEYKKFALTAAWMPQTDELGRRARPNRSLWERDVWWLSSVDDEGKWVEDALTATETVGVPCASHVYQWHRIPFDNDYPHYFPVRDCLPEGLARLQNGGVLAMPYINGRLWDTRDREDTDWLFSSLARDRATKDMDGKLFEETYLSKEKDGSSVSLAVMCPSTSLWQDKVSELADGVLNDLGCDGLYVDQVACAEAKPCCDPLHPHAPGGGAWWINAYRTMMDRLNARKSPRKFFTTEGTSDAYLRSFDGFLSWMWWYNGQVPALAVVYAGKAVFFGRQYAPVDDATRRIYAAQSLLFGEQLGWISPRDYLDGDFRDFFTACARMRNTYHPWFAEGELLRPPTTVCEGEEVRGSSQVGGLHCAPVLSAVWRERESGICRLFLAAPAREDCTVHISHDLVGRALHFTGTHETDASFCEGVLSLTVPAGAVLCAEL